MCVGDSITWGTRQLFQESIGGYRLPLTVLMDEAGWSYDMVGSQADGPDTGWDRDHEGYRGWKIEEIEAIMPDRLAAYAPDVILLLIGTNNRREGATVAFPRMEPLLDTIYANDPDVEVYVGTLTPRTDTDSSPSGPQFAIDFNAQLPALIQAQVDLGRKVHLVDLFGGMLGVDIIDGVHPTLGGYHRMAEIWFEALSATMGDTNGNKPPAVSISSPADGGTLAAGTPLLIEATPTDPDGSIVRVDFLINQAYAGSATSSSGGTWSLTIPEPPVGTHDLRAVAVDNRGAAYANPIPVSVTIGGTAPFSYGLVAHWPMRSGHRYHVADESGYGLRLHRAEFCDFIDGASSPSSDGGLAMPAGAAFAEDASHLNFTEDFAFAGWVKWDGTAGVYQTILEKGDNYKIGTYQVYPGDTTAEIYLRIRKASGTSNVRSGLYLSANTWHFVAVSKDGSQVTFRIDGTTATASAPTTMEANTDRVTVGSEMDFSFDEFRLYNRPLNTAELDALEDLFVGSNPPPASPGNPNASAVAYNRIDVSWTDNSDNETSFVIERSLAGGGSGFSVAGAVAANTTSFIDTSVDPETTYFYRINASNVTADSAPTAEVSATTPAEPMTPPLAPGGLSAVATAVDQIDLSWTDNSDRETGFVIERSTTGGGSGFAEIHVTAADTTTYSDQGLDSSTTYFYRVKARNAYGDSSPTAEASAQTWAASAFPISESFDAGYTAGSDLTGQNGWSGSALIEVDATGLEHPGMLGESGYSIRGVTAFASSGAGIVTAPMVGTDDTTGPGELWFAGLISMTDNSGTDYNYLRFLFDSSGGTAVTVGLLDNQFVANGSTGGFSGTQYTAGTTALIVGKMTVTSTGNSTNETFDFWFNPTDATSEASLTGTAEGTILAKGINAINGDWGSVTIATHMSGSNLNTWYQDEIRVAESLAGLNLEGAGVEPLSPGQSWRLLHFGTTDNTGVAANDFDAEADGLSNIVERATGRDPNASDTVETSVSKGDASGNPDPAGSWWLYTHPRISGGSVIGDTYFADEIEYQVLWSDDLVNWHPDVAEFVGATASGISGIENATFRVDSALSPELSFFRLGISPVTPAAPDNLTSPSVGHDSVLLNWNDNADDETGYLIEISTDGVNFTALPALPADSTSFEVTGLSPESEYTFRIRATGAEGDSAFTADLVVSTTSIPILDGLLPFHIGNSLTQMRSIPQQVTAFAQSAGYTDHASIQSTISGHYLWEHWQGIDGSTAPDNIANGLYDTVVLQGNSAEWEPGRIGNFRTNAQNFHNAGVANRDAQTWIYSYWPGSNEPLQWQRYVSEAFEGVRPQLTGGKWARIIPVGDAVESFLQARDDGRITGIPRGDFYSDTIHPSTTGGYFISLVHYASLYGVSPVGLPANNGIAGVGASLATEMQTMIWEFLQTYPFAGVYPGMPAVAFDADTHTGFAPLTVNFDASASFVPDGTESISAVSWEILREGEATPTTDSGLTLAETFTIPGIYHVTAIATSSNGRTSAPLTQAVRVSEAPSTPMIGITFNTDQGGSLAVNEYAGVARQLNWNNYAGRTSGSIPSLLDNTGNPSGSLNLSCPSGFRSQGVLTFPDPDFRMLHGFVRNDSSTALVITLTGLPATFSDNGFDVIVYCNAYPNPSDYPDNRQILVDWGNTGIIDETLTGLTQWAMPDYDETRPHYDYTDASGAPQFYHKIQIPSGHSALSLTVPSSGSYFAISGMQIVAGF